MTLQFEDGSDYAFSRAAGALAGILIPLAISIRAIKSHSEPDHSRHCALSLSLVAGGWTLSTAVYALHLLTSSLESLLLVTVIVVGVLDLAGIVTAILGLLDVAVERRTPLSG